MLITPQSKGNANGVTTNSILATTDKARLYVSAGLIQSASVSIYRMMENGDWLKTAEETGLQLKVGESSFVDFDVHAAGERLMVVYSGSLGSDATCYLSSLSTPTSAAAQAQTPTAPLGSALTDDALVVGNVLYMKGSGNLGKNTGATEAIAAAILGISDASYAGAATAKYFVDGQLVTGLSGLTPGVEYFAKEDATLDTFANVTSTKYTRAMGVAESATALRVRIGDVIQKQ